jgi:hypothetical protein
MSTRLFTDMVEDVNPDVPGCPYDTIKRAIRQAAIDACEYTLLWRHEVPSFLLTPSMHEYVFTKPADSEVCAVFGVMMNNFPIRILTLSEALEEFPQWADFMGGLDPLNAWENTPASQFNQDEYNASTYNQNPAFQTPEAALVNTSTPLAFTQLNPHKFIVLPSPNDAQSYKLRMFLALKPSRTSEGMDLYAANELNEVIHHRAVQKLAVMPDKPWTNFDVASYHARQYRFLASERRAKANLTTGRGRVRVQLRGFT